MSNLFKKIVKIAKKNNNYTFLLNEDNPYEVKEWIDTGCYILNAALSNGDITKGLPEGKKIQIAGESSTAKSFFTALLIRKYLKDNPKSYAVFFETEGSTIVDMAKSFNIPTDRIIIIPVITIEDCRTQMVNILDHIIDTKEGYETKIDKETKKKTRKKVSEGKNKDDKFIFCVDSLGMLSTKKETNDVSSGSDKKDMTRAQLIKGFARVISLKLSITKIPLIVVNHAYATFDKYNPSEVSGGSGIKYMSDITLMLSKTKEKEEKEQIGVIITINILKSRYMKENKNVKIFLHWKKGLYKWSDLMRKVKDLKIFEKEGFSYLLPDGTKIKMKEVRENTAKFLSIPENFNAVQRAIKDDFSFGDCIKDDDEDDFKIIDDINEQDDIKEQDD